MSAANKQFLLLLLIVTSPSVSWASEPGGGVPDAYERINRLVDSLRFWAADTSAAGAGFQDQSVEAPDSVDLADLFPDGVIVREDSLNAYQITLPRYMDMLETGLSLVINSSRSPDSPTGRWTSPVARSGDGLSIDGRLVACDPLIVRDSILVDGIRLRLTTLRTLGLPREWRNSHSEEDGIPVMVTVRGRDSRHIEFSLKLWLQSLGRIASGRQVYAGLLDSRFGAGEVELKYYILITYPGAQGHHFLEWTERVEMSETGWATAGIDIVFIPYVRTDNLKNLFAQPERSGNEPLELPVGR